MPSLDRRLMLELFVDRVEDKHSLVSWQSTQVALRIGRVFDDERHDLAFSPNGCQSRRRFLLDRPNDPSGLAAWRQGDVDMRLVCRNCWPEDQEDFLLRQNGEFSDEQIAAATSLPVGTVKTRMRAAMQR